MGGLSLRQPEFRSGMGPVVDLEMRRVVTHF